MRELGLNYGFTPQDIGRMTLYQLRIYLSDEGDLGGKQALSPAEAHSLVERRRMLRQMGS